MTPKLKKIQYKKNYTYHVLFMNGQEGDIDFKPFLCGEAFEMLKDPIYFKKAFIDKTTGTITWPNNTDIAPETLYKKIVGDFSHSGISLADRS